MDSFQEFFARVTKVYKYFGVAPSWKSLEHPKLTTGRAKLSTWMPVLCSLLVYWITLTFCLLNKENTEDLISLMSNYIQILMNAATFSVTLISTVVNRKHFKRILSEFERIDRKFKAVRCPIDYAKHLRVFYATVTIFWVVLVAKYVFEAFVFLFMYNMFSVLYWLVYIVPFVIYGTCLHQATFIIYCVLVRCRMVHDLLESKRFPKKKLIVQPTMMTFEGMNSGDTSCETIKVVHQLTDGIHELCYRINGFFGLTFLASMMTMFAITSIQAFYCYKVGSAMDETKKRTVWTLVASVNPVVVNITLVAIMAYMSDVLTTQATKINTSVRKLEDELAIQYSSWLHPVLINIKISAFGFFDINCTMLCGFLSAWITYLLILVQCNEIGGDVKLDHQSMNHND